MNVRVPLKLVTLAPDPVQYKPYNPVFTAPDGQQIILNISIPEEGVMGTVDENELDDEQVILSPYVELNEYGFQCLLENLAELVLTAHYDRITNQANIVKP